MASRSLIKYRNAEIVQIWHIMRHEQGRTADFTINYIKKNYWIDKWQIYDILAEEGIPFQIDEEEASEAFKRVANASL